MALAAWLGQLGIVYGGAGLGKTTVLKQYAATKTMRTEQENALYNGVTPIETSPAGTQAQIVRAITTYTKTANGTADESLLDVTTVRTLIYVSRACVDRIALRFPRDKLSDRTPPRVRSELIDVLMRCEELEILERVEENLPKLIVEQAQTATQVGYGATAASAAAVSAKAVGGGGGFWSNWGSKLLGSKAGFGLGLLLHSEELNKGEAEFVALQRQYAKKRASTTQAPLDSPVLKDSILQLDQSAQTNQQASQQYMQAAAENQAATAQMTGAAAQMTAAAAQMQAAAGRPIPVTVTVQNGNIVAYVNQAVERNSRKN